VKAEVTEHQVLTVKCGCGCETKAGAPHYAPVPVQYGPRIMGTGIYLWHGPLGFPSPQQHRLPKWNPPPPSHRSIHRGNPPVSSRLPHTQAGKRKFQKTYLVTISVTFSLRQLHRVIAQAR
jgi:hypothetical protein